MKEIRYTDHLQLRLRYRGYSTDLPKIIYKKAETHYFDMITSHHIVTYETEVFEKIRTMMIAYDDHFSYVDIVTIHPINQEQIRKRIDSGRWIKI